MSDEKPQTASPPSEGPKPIVAPIKFSNKTIVKEWRLPNGHVYRQEVITPIIFPKSKTAMHRKEVIDQLVQWESESKISRCNANEIYHLLKKHKKAYDSYRDYYQWTQIREPGFYDDIERSLWNLATVAALSCSSALSDDERSFIAKKLYHEVLVFAMNFPTQVEKIVELVPSNDCFRLRYEQFRKLPRFNKSLLKFVREAYHAELCKTTKLSLEEVDAEVDKRFPQQRKEPENG